MTEIVDDSPLSVELLMSVDKEVDVKEEGELVIGLLLSGIDDEVPIL